MDDIKQYYFSVNVAREVGLEEAVMFSNIFFWSRLNERNRSERHYHEGVYWTYNSVREFIEKYPFWTTAQINRILRNLEKADYIRIGCFNRHRYDKTRWFTPSEKGHATAVSDNVFVETVDSNIPF